jgi:hypothetical protein
MGRCSLPGRLKQVRVYRIAASLRSRGGRPLARNRVLLKEWSCAMMSTGSATSPSRRHHTEDLGTMQAKGAPVAYSFRIVKPKGGFTTLSRADAE